jgi:hypothetical protein
VAPLNAGRRPWLCLLGAASSRGMPSIRPMACALAGSRQPIVSVPAEVKATLDVGIRRRSERLHDDVKLMVSKHFLLGSVDCR